MKRLLLAAALAATPVLAAESGLEREFPSGSILTREQAASAINAARARAKAIEQEFRATDERCAKEFMVTRCRNNARNRRDLEMREVDRIQLEAHEVTRRLDAQQRAERRTEDAARRAAEAPAEAKRVEDSRKAFDARQRAAAERAAPPPNKAARPAAAGEREPPHPPAVRKAPAPISRQPNAEQRAENVRRLQEKQRAAEEYARAKAAERAENEQRRAARRQERLNEERRRAAAAPAK